MMKHPGGLPPDNRSAADVVQAVLPREDAFGENVAPSGSYSFGHGASAQASTSLDVCVPRWTCVPYIFIRRYLYPLVSGIVPPVSWL